MTEIRHGSFEFGIDIVKRGHELVVRKDGVDQRSFHEISDDYAHTNAKAYAYDLMFKARTASKKKSTE